MFKYALLVSALLISGCATVERDWVAIGGSKSDGIVKLGYEQNEFEIVELSPAQGARVATQRCRAWGYQKAEGFEGEMKQCHSRGGFKGCREWTVTKEYQCIGGNPSK